MSSRSQAFGAFRLDADRRTLRIGDQAVDIGSRGIELLLLLAERRPQFVSKADLMARGWPGAPVAEATLRSQIGDLRRALRGDPRVQIVNAPNRGYRLVGPGAQPAPTPPGPSPRHNLPRRLTPLIGREAAVDEVVTAVRRQRLTTLVGPGGMGKTSVALAAAERLVPSFDRVTLVDFSPIEERADVLAAFRSVLEAGTDGAVRLPDVAAALRGGRTLLVLDNCEHLSEEVGSLAEALLGMLSRVRVLATSREPLEIRGERTIRVAPLDVPPQAPGLEFAALSADEALGFSAVRLFVDRASGGAGYRFTGADAEAVAALVRRLDGMPLALELAAAWVEAFPPRSLAAELNDHFLLEARGRRTALPRHRTLRAMLAWSFDRLEPEHQALFRRLGVFRGRFDGRAAVEVAAHGELNPTDVLRGLDELVRRSLIEQEPERGYTRYGLFMVPRAFACESLVGRPDERPTRRRHAQWALDRADRAEARLEGTPWRAGRLAVLDELHAALEWAQSEGEEAWLTQGLASRYHSLEQMAQESG